MSHWTIAFHETLYFIKDITFTFTRLHLATTLDGDFIPPGGEYPARLASNDGPSSAGICAFRALKEKGILSIPDLEVCREGGLEIRGQLGINRHHVPLLREFAKFFKRRFDSREEQRPRA